MQKVLILAIGDKFWVDFALKFSKRLSEQNIESVIVMDSRIGEYQLFFKRINYQTNSVHYLSDYVNEQGDVTMNSEHTRGNFSPVFNDYLRLKKIGLLNKIINPDLPKSNRLVAGFLDSIFSKYNISIVVHETVSSSFSFIASNMANAKSIPYIGFVPAKIPNRFEIKKSVNSESDEVEHIYNDIMSKKTILSDEDINWAKNYINTLDDQVQGFMKTGTLNNLSWTNLLNNKNFRLLYGTLLYTLKENRDSSGILFRAKPIHHAVASFKRNAIRRLRKPFLKKYFDNIDEKWLKKNKFYIYPIHYQPEASTTVGAPFFDDQLALLTQISFLLPIDSYLLIKEHKSNMGYNSATFYRELQKLPNVKLISEDANIKSMIKESEALITLTGTAGYEAVLLDTPVFIFGNVSYDKHPLCKRFISWNEFEHDLIQWPVDCKSIKYDNIAFLNAYKQYTYVGNVDYNKSEFNIGQELLDIVIETLRKKI